MSKKETFKMLNGNKQIIIKTPPFIWILDRMNDTAKEWLEMQTGLILTRHGLRGYCAQPQKTQQITQLLLTYNFRTRYFDNGDYSNTLMLKFSRDADWNLP